MARNIAVCAFEAMQGEFVWGRNDCCLSACNVFYQVYGFDPMGEFNGAYTDKRSAVALFKKHGGLLQMAETQAAKYGMIEGVGGAGELGITNSAIGSALAICLGDGIWAAKTQKGMAMITAVKRCWRV